MMREIAVPRTRAPRPRPRQSDLGFGHHFTDHMFMAEWSAERGWHEPRVVPYGPFSFEPAAGVFHYGQAMFEGLKAYRGVDGKVRLFRAERHCRRMAEGAPRLAMPPPDPELLHAGIAAVVRTDADWAPSAHGTSLYIRPTLVASEAFLGVRAAQRYLLFVILSPVGAYWPDGMAPVKIWVERDSVRAVRGGTGASK